MKIKTIKLCIFGAKIQIPLKSHFFHPQWWSRNVIYLAVRLQMMIGGRETQFRLDAEAGGLRGCFWPRITEKRKPEDFRVLLNSASHAPPKPPQKRPKSPFLFLFLDGASVSLLFTKKTFFKVFSMILNKKVWGKKKSFEERTWGWEFRLGVFLGRKLA